MTWFEIGKSNLRAAQQILNGDVRRLDADYKRTVTVDRAIALESIRDASTWFNLLEV